ncbi:VpsF family polysaccharide biosynthesis protein [Rhodoblastus acidophilus]|uniref:VpsF family polysaccharide biosynthesis protein n=1 Tax=Rhodoblastus acidophilus TaxID=1074 RepID=UPI000B50851B|nr:VpsF family polysaccharide biosynthesis protein [Rhodoblastus acidophilus]PPQ38699.1 hypothetical protein CKO16_08775 [Rhodoblastus acidophilus]
MTLATITLVAAMLACFAISTMALSAVGLKYDVAEGPAWEKLHPATYLATLAIAFRFLGQRHPLRYARSLLQQLPGAAFFLAMWVSLAAYSVLVQQTPLSAIIETYLVALAALFAYDDLSPAMRDFMRKALHVILVVNAAVGVLELVTQTRLFPYAIAGLPVPGDDRPTAILGHPLMNASTTGAYLLCLCLGGDPQLGPRRRVAIIGLCLLALAVFGGRTALVLSSLIVGGVLAFKFAFFLLGARVDLGRVLAGLILTPLLLLAVAGAASAGMFDNTIARFVDDSGSAQSRVVALQLFNMFDTSDVLFGPRLDLLISNLGMAGIPIGIENTWIALIFLYGAWMTLFFVIGLIALLFEYWRRARPGVSVLLIYFLIIVSSMNGLSTKSMIFNQFSLLLLFMFNKESAARMAPEAGGDRD